MKITNRFSAGSFIAVHDELWMDLCKLNTALAKYTIKERTICGKKYLVNSFVKDNKYEVGFVVEVPKELVTTGVDLDRLSNHVYDQYTMLYKSMEEKLRLSASEILVADILFNDFLTNSVINHLTFNRISFRDIERYRSKSSVKRCDVIKDETANSYGKIIESLCSKTVYLKTTETFRDVKYGVNNKNIMQPLLTIDYVWKAGVNNFEFNYSFGNFGKFIRRSRRYSNILPSVCYKYNFNQANKHCVAMFIAQILYYENYRKAKGKNILSSATYDCIIEAVSMCEWTYSKYKITSKEFHKFRGYVEDILAVLHRAGEIGEYAVTASVRPGRCEKKYDLAYQIKLLNEMKQNGYDTGNLAPSICMDNQDETISYPNITSYAAFKLSTGSTNQKAMKCEPTNGCKAKEIKESCSLYKSLKESR